MIATINKSLAKGEIVAPPSKSMAHRYLFCASLCDKTSVIKNISNSKDMIATIQSLKAIGVKFDIKDNLVKVTGINPKSIKIKDTVDCIESGSTLRFIIPILLLSDDEAFLTGSERLFERPLEVYEKICKEQNLIFSQENNSLKVKGSLKAGVFEIDGSISSQFISGLLFALPCLKGDSRIIIKESFESKPYVYMTISALEKFGIKVELNGNEIFVKGNQQYEPFNGSVEGDYSNAVFTDVFNYLGGEVTVLGLDENSLQGDKIYNEHLKALDKGNIVIDISDCPDLAPILITFAAIKHGATFKGTKRLKIKESDRGEAIAKELRKLGANIKVFENEIELIPCELHSASKPLFGHNDHRIVMSLCVALTKTGGEINGAEAISKSYPNFFENIKKLGIEVTLN